MIGRILHLAVIDILAVGVAMGGQASSAAHSGSATDAPQAATTDPMPDFSRLTSHSR